MALCSTSDGAWAGEQDFGFVLVSPSGALVGYGHVTPPGWITDAAGAELWAYLVAVSESVQIPRVTTDCKGILDALRRHSEDLVNENAPLARTWALIVAALDGQIHAAAELTTWMPSHVSAQRMLADAPHNSAGVPVSWIAWRANRLADALAKAAAQATRLPASLFKWMQDLDLMHIHMAATLGLVTHQANNYIPSTAVMEMDNGDEAREGARIQPRRDAEGLRAYAPRTWRRGKPDQAVQLLAAQAASSSSTAPSPNTSRCPPQAKRRRCALASLQVQRVADAAQVARHLEATVLRPSGEPSSAADRLAALRQRVQAKEQEEAAWL